MGRNKAQLPFRGATLIEHALENLRRAGFEAAVAGLRGNQSASAPCMEDNFPDSGPLGGIEAALRSVAHQPALFIPVDLPLLPTAFLQALWHRARTTEALATVPFAQGRPQPLCAVYHSQLAPGIAAALEQGDRKVMRVFRMLVPPPYFDSFRVEALAPLHGWEESHRWFANLNTPDDYARLESDAEAAKEPLVVTCLAGNAGPA